MTSSRSPWVRSGLSVRRSISYANFYFGLKMVHNLIIIFKWTEERGSWACIALALITPSVSVLHLKSSDHARHYDSQIRLSCIWVARFKARMKMNVCPGYRINILGRMTWREMAFKNFAAKLFYRLCYVLLVLFSYENKSNNTWQALYTVKMSAAVSYERVLKSF